MNVQELKAKLNNDEDFLMIDVREPWEYEEFNLGAELIPLGQIGSAIEMYKDKKNHPIVVLCRSGVRSAMAQQMLIQAGFLNVKNLSGGILDWIQKFGK